jgi:hypothetical protein
MDRHWLTSYGTHIPTEIDPDAYGSAPWCATPTSQRSAVSAKR